MIADHFNAEVVFAFGARRARLEMLVNVCAHITDVSTEKKRKPNTGWRIALFWLSATLST